MKPGEIGWLDLTVPDASALRSFYERVLGWRSEPVAMNGYDDFSMIPDGAQGAVAGICHARGDNAGLPPVWLVYFVVADLEASLSHCESDGGKVLLPPRGAAGSRFAVIQDPAGACCALYEASS